MPDSGQLILRTGYQPLTFAEGDNNIRYAALQSQSINYTTHYFQSNSLILSRSNGGGIEIKDLGTFTASYAMKALTASYAVSSSTITNTYLYATYSNFVTSSFVKLIATDDAYPVPGTSQVGKFIYTGSIDFTKGNGNNVTASFRLPTVFYEDITLSGSTTNVDGNFQVVTGDDYLSGVKIFRGEEPGNTFKQFLALNFANGNGNIVAFDPDYDNPRYHFRLSGSTINRALLSVEKPGAQSPQLVLGGTWFTAGDEATTYTSYFSGSAVFLSGATGSLLGTASGNFHSSSLSGTNLSLFRPNGTSVVYSLGGSQNLQSVTTTGNSTTQSVIISNNFSNGEGTSVPGLYVHAEGYQTTAASSYSHAEGYQTVTDGTATHAEGEGATAKRGGAHAEGYYTTAEGNGSHTEGYRTRTYNSIGTPGSQHAEGYYTYAIGSYSHAEGYYTITLTSAIGAHAEGYYVSASGTYSHAEGSRTTSIGIASHAEGESTTAKGDSSHAAGYKTISSAPYQFVVGHGNVEQTTTYNTVGYRPFIVGGGGITGTASNLLEVAITKLNPGNENDGTIVLPRVLGAAMNFGSDAAAAAAGVPLGGVYRNGGTLRIRII